MKASYVILSAAIPLLGACASHSTSTGHEAWDVKPVYSVRHSSETPESYYLLGRYYQGQNRYEQALTAYKKALAIDSNFAEARNGLGVVYASQGRLPEALEQFSLAAQLAPNTSHIQNNLGYAQYLNRSYSESVNTLEKAIALDPSNQSARVNLALALDKAGDMDKAVQVIAQAPASESSPTEPQEASRLQTASQPVSAQAAASAPISATEARPQSELTADKFTGQKLGLPTAKPYRIEVSNGNGVTGMAKKVANFLDGEGYSGSRLTNQKSFQMPTSRVQYRSGYREHAQSLAQTLPGNPAVEQADDLRTDISIRVILGKDMAGNVAKFERH